MIIMFTGDNEKRKMPRYGLRKMKWGVASVLLATMILAGNGSTANADTTTTNSNVQNEVSTSDNQGSSKITEKTNNAITGSQNNSENVSNEPTENEVSNPEQPTFNAVKNPRDVTYNGHSYHLEGQMYKYISDGHGNDTVKPVDDQELLADLQFTTDDISDEQLVKLGLKRNEFIVHVPDGTDEKGKHVYAYDAKEFMQNGDQAIALQNDYGQIIISNIMPVHNPDGSLKVTVVTDSDYLINKYLANQWNGISGNIIVDPSYPRLGFEKDDLNKVITRTINVINPDGTVNTKIQKVHFSRNGLVNSNFRPVFDNEGYFVDFDGIETKIGYDNNKDYIPDYTMEQGDQAWITDKNSFDEYDVPKLDGYQPTISRVEKATVTPDTLDSVVNITYTHTQIKHKHDTGDPLVNDKPTYDLSKLHKHDTGESLINEKPAYDLSKLHKHDTGDPLINEKPAYDLTKLHKHDTGEPLINEKPAYDITKLHKHDTDNPLINNKPENNLDNPNKHETNNPVVQPNTSDNNYQVLTVTNTPAKPQPTTNKETPKSLPQSGNNQEVASVVSLLGMALLSSLGLAWVSRKKVK